MSLDRDDSAGAYREGYAAGLAEGEKRAAERIAASEVVRSTAVAENDRLRAAIADTDANVCAILDAMDVPPDSMTIEDGARAILAAIRRRANGDHLPAPAGEGAGVCACETVRGKPKAALCAFCQGAAGEGEGG